MVQGRSARIGVDAILDAVLALGFDAASTSAVARALSVEQPALYRHVASKAEMLDLAAARALERMSGGSDDDRADVTDDWRRRMLDFQSALWDRLDGVAGLAAYLLSVPVLPAPLLGACERAVVGLQRAGIDPRRAVLGLDAAVHLTCLSHLGSERLAIPEVAERWSDRIAAIEDEGSELTVLAIAGTDPRSLAEEQLGILLDGLAHGTGTAPRS